MFQSQAQHFPISQIDTPIGIDIQLIPPPSLSLFKREIHLEFVFRRFRARFEKFGDYAFVGGEVPFAEMEAFGSE